MLEDFSFQFDLMHKHMTADIFITAHPLYRVWSFTDDSPIIRL